MLWKREGKHKKQRNENIWPAKLEQSRDTNQFNVTQHHTDNLFGLQISLTAYSFCCFIKYSYYVWHTAYCIIMIILCAPCRDRDLVQVIFLPQKIRRNKWEIIFCIRKNAFFEYFWTFLCQLSTFFSTNSLYVTHEHLTIITTLNITKLSSTKRYFIMEISVVLFWLMWKA